MSARSNLTFFGTLVFAILLPVGVSVGILLPISYPISSPAYQQLPTMVPIVGGICSAGIAVFYDSKRTTVKPRRFARIAALVIISFLLSWYLTMFIVLNTKGS